MLVVVGTRFKKAYCDSDETKNFILGLPREIFYKGDSITSLEDTPLDEEFDESDYADALDEYCWELVSETKRAQLCDGLKIEYFFSCDEESAIFGVKVHEISDAGEDNLQSLLDVGDYIAKVKVKVKKLYLSWGLPQEYVDGVDTYFTIDW